MRGKGKWKQRLPKYCRSFSQLFTLSERIWDILCSRSSGDRILRRVLSGGGGVKDKDVVRFHSWRTRTLLLSPKRWPDEKNSLYCHEAYSIGLSRRRRKKKRYWSGRARPKNWEKKGNFLFCDPSRICVDIWRFFTTLDSEILIKSYPRLFRKGRKKRRSFSEEIHSTRGSEPINSMVNSRNYGVFLLTISIVFSLSLTDPKSFSSI